MAAKIRHGVAAGGADNTTNSSWYDMGGTASFVAATVTTSGDQVIGIVPFVDTYSPDFLPAATPIMRLFGAYIALDSALIAESTLSLLVSVYRANVQVGGQEAFGWLLAAAGTPAIAALTGVKMPALTANTALLGNASAGYYMNVNPGDVLVFRQNCSGSVAVPTGAVTLIMR